MAQEIISRAEAEAKGLPRYQGNPCKYGHGGERYTVTGTCVSCCKIHATKRYAPRPARGSQKRTQQKSAHAMKNELKRQQRAARRYDDQLATINLF
jgi:hypothetical protein